MADVSYRELFRIFGHIGLLSFGGPAAQIALMHRELVDRTGWLDEATFLRALSFTMLLPGPEAMQLATYAGWRLRGVPGGLLAGLLFVLPGAVVIFALAHAYVALGDLPLVHALFLGVKAAVVVIVIEALVQGRAARACMAPDTGSLRGCPFWRSLSLALPFPLHHRGSGALGFPDDRRCGAAAHPRCHAGHGAWRGQSPSGARSGSRPSPRCWASGATFLTEIALFFSKLAVVTFGGAYAVLAYMTQEVVARPGLADHGADDGRAGSGRNHARPADPCHAIRGLSRRRRRRRHRHGAGGGRLSRSGSPSCPVFSGFSSARPISTGSPRRPRLTGALARDHGRRGRGDPEPVALVRDPCSLSRVDVIAWGPLHMIAPDPASLDPVAASLVAIAATLLLVLHWPLLRVLLIAAVLGLASPAIG